MRQSSGYSLVELLLASAIFMTLAAGIVAVAGPAHAALSAETEASDMDQRLRVAADALFDDVSMAGAGASAGVMSGSLGFYVAAVLPYRVGARGADPPGTFRSDTITVLYVPQTAAQTVTGGDLVDGVDTIPIVRGPGCPPADAACGFSVGDTALVFDASGGFTTLSIVAVDAVSGLLTVVKPPAAAGALFRAGAKIVKAVDRTYALKSDPALNVFQLVSYDGANGADVPVVDHVVGLQFDYFGEPQPPRWIDRAAACDGDPSRLPCTTYGPPPPAPAVQVAAGYPPGENCAFALDPDTAAPVPRLDVLGGDAARVTPTVLSSALLTDGPWCPDASSANRYDADLLRVRAVQVRVRVQAAIDALRGPAGPLFARGGTATDAKRFLPDREIAFRVAPRNLNLPR
jgi:hypothetical protein